MTEARAIVDACAIWLATLRPPNSRKGRLESHATLGVASYLLDQAAKGVRGEAARAALWEAIT